MEEKKDKTQRVKNKQTITREFLFPKRGDHTPDDTDFLNGW